MITLNEGVFTDFPVIKTNRLHMRQIVPEDATQVFAMRSNHRVNEFITRMPMGSVHEAHKLIDVLTEKYNNREAIGWAISLRDSGTIIGTCGFNRIEKANLRAEMGGEMDPHYWGKHIALETVKAIVEFGFTHMNLHSIEARVDPGNRGAIHLLDSIGFEREGYFRDFVYFNGRFRDMAVYSLVAGR